MSLMYLSIASIGVRLALFIWWWNYKKCTMKRLLSTYHNVFKMSISMSKYESTSVLCTVIYIMCSVVRLSSEILCIVSCVGFRHPTIVQSCLFSLPVYAVSHEMVFNHKKSVILICRSKIT